MSPASIPHSPEKSIPVSLPSCPDVSNIFPVARRSGSRSFSAFAQLERDIIRERTMAGLERARAQGKKLGRPLKSGKVYKRPSLSDVSRLHSEGKSLREIAKELETSKYWVEYSINKIKEGVKVVV